MDLPADTKLLNDDPNAFIYFSENKSLVIVEIKEVDMINEDIYKKNALALLDFVKRKNVKYLIFNTLNLKTIFTIHLQKWVAKNINSELIKIMEKIAIIEPQEPISHLSLQMYVEESNKFGPLAEEKFFTNVPDALKWILGN